jgi:tetratricopeptide (TPR) repeat protein
MPTRKSGRGDTGRPTEPPLPDRRVMEQQMSAITRLLAEREFASIEEANAYLREALVEGTVPTPAPATPLEEAQEVIYQALEAHGKRRLDLARHALTISPDVADAYVLLAEAATAPEEARRLYEQGVQAGERALGPDAFTEDVGHFWGIVETRPYMRARQGLAEVLWHLGERPAAIAHLQDMLRLNPGDNQGLRYTLASWLLTVGDDAALERLLAAYPDEASAHWAYTRALLTFRRQGPGTAADQDLRRALRANPHVPAYLLGMKPFPAQLPDHYGIGDDNEAVIYLAEAAEGWLGTPEAPEWLAAALKRLRPSSSTPKPRRPRRT